MLELDFTCLDVQAQRWAAAPTLRIRLGVTGPPDVRVHAGVLTCQLRIDPRARDYTDAEAQKLACVFGEPSRWAASMQQLQFATVTAMLPGFTDRTEMELLVPCSYDLEVGLGKFFHALSGGDVPLTLLFSGTVFVATEAGVQVARVPWDREAGYRMPAAIWRDLMDLYFPDSAWIRLRRDTTDALLRYQARHAVPSADVALAGLLAAQQEEAACPAPR
ncbi:DUF6084 family protein [Catellatospora sp. KI3]|uniref:DUF6084 family protein n=1 Tax=Catellatospora sp. KI3 TaxID=3041620 RepID=UPI002482ACE4|nr:DUF6084 family protein [Catellatospora sp. KI3]MDI1465673.1 DUF6084 family protein [Catellatospora sp. KI3]